MMWIKNSVIDERVRAAAGRAAAIWLGVTQVLLAGVVFYRLLILGQPDADIRDFQAVLAISLFGYIALQLYVEEHLAPCFRRSSHRGGPLFAGGVAG